jgi:hypothetical protein
MRSTRGTLYSQKRISFLANKCSHVCFAGFYSLLLRVLITIQNDTQPIMKAIKETIAL